MATPVVSSTGYSEFAGELLISCLMSLIEFSLVFADSVRSNWIDLPFPAVSGRARETLMKLFGVAWSGKMFATSDDSLSSTGYM